MLLVLLGLAAASTSFRTEDTRANTSSWSTSNNNLLRNGKEVLLHGLGSTCTEYLTRGIGMECWASYQWNDKAHLIETLDSAQTDAFTDVLTQAATDGVMPIVRIPLCASSWLGVKTNASSNNMDKYPDLSGQYQKMISALVENYTNKGIVSILDLHWNDDDKEQQPMALKKRSDGGPTGNALDFWDSIAQKFGDNELAFFELYNEPYIGDTNVWMHGNDEYAGMLEMITTIRQHAPNNVLIIAGSAGWAYDADSLVTLDTQLHTTGESLVMYNFHPYMGPAQAGASNKCPAGFESFVETLKLSTDKPMIITEFGQACCSTHGECEHCPASGWGYDEEILNTCVANRVSWLPWAWRPSAAGDGGGSGCQDLNGASGGKSLEHPTNGKGADFATLWNTYRHKIS